jgi:ABC-type sugar transport system substrate-binding protein
VLLLVKTQDNPFFRDVESGVREGWSHLTEPPTLHVRGGKNEGDVSAQRQVLDDFISRYASDGASQLRGVILTPASSGADLVPYITRLRTLHIPVILVDTQIDKAALDAGHTDYDVFIGSSNLQGGESAAQLLEKQISAGKVLLLNGVDGQETAVARRNGFLTAIQKKGSYQIVERTCNWRRTEARTTLEGLLSLGQHFDAIFAANDEMALGAAEAVRQHTDIKAPSAIIGFDATVEARDAVQKGLLTATLAQDPAGMGAKAVEALASIWAKRNVEKDQQLPVITVERK